ncbi:hypothetical protein INT45_008133 [Circinella minor]|uniref:Uncharacterized protein n=1 Tax=Circinella minor TaxID=1195481 RepID=A0A8H7RTK2_9FUNG|nr:hypothetical protein INT45_008133 [Circinella minor]
MQQQEDHPLQRLKQTTGSAALAPNLGRTGGTTTPIATTSNEGLQNHVTTTNGHFHGICHELSETSARLVALDKANDRMVA